MTSPTRLAAFDGYAAAYDAALNSGIAVSGEDKNFFAQGRVAWTAQRLRQLGLPSQRVLDYGCGTGSATPFLLSELAAQSLVGLDVSEQSLEIARAKFGSPAVRFVTPTELDSGFDVAYCNGVFHHVAVSDRPSLVAQVFSALKPGGVFALWENNPYNPGTRYVMWRIPFDRDAVLVWPGQARRLTEQAGFRWLCTDFLFIFPRLLRWLRRFEPAFAGWPLGAQYLTLAQKPFA